MNSMRTSDHKAAARTLTPVALAALAVFGLSTVLTVKPARAQASAPQADAGTQTITITTNARKRKEAVQDVPMSMELLTGKDLQDAGILRVQDIQASVPGLVVTGFETQGNVVLRGIGTGDVGLGTDQSVAIHIDGVYQTFGGAGLSRLFDVSAVEVLKGPQGTLYGRNATAGVINILSNAPVNRFAAEADVSVGTLSTVIGQGFINVPVSEDTAVRLAFAAGSSKGAITNTKDGSRVGDLDDFAALRLGVRSQIGDTRADLRVQFIEDRSSVSQALVQMPYDSVTGPGAGWTDRAFYIQQPEAKRQDLNAALTFVVPLGDAALTSITGYGRHTGQALYALGFGQTEDERVIQATDEPHSLISQELQLNFTTGTATDWVAGVYAMTYDGEDKRMLDTGPLSVLGGYTTNMAGKVEGRTAAAFTDVSQPLTSTLKLNGGIRYTWERKEATAFGTGPFDVNPAVVDDKSWSAWSGRIGLDWQVTKSSKIWGNLSEGFKSGGVIPQSNNGGGGICESGQFLPNGCAITIYRPEKLRALEIGQKTTLADGAGFINAALFHYDYRDKVEFYQYDPSNPLSFTFNNAQEAKVTGLELSGDFRLTRYLRTDISAAFLDTEYTRFVDSVGNDVATGNHLPRAPKASATVALTGEALPLASGLLRFRVEYAWRDLIYFDFLNNAAGFHTFERAIGLVNASLGWAMPGSRWAFYARGRNLNDTRYLEFARDGLSDVVPAPGRSFQVGANYRF